MELQISNSFATTELSTEYGIDFRFSNYHLSSRQIYCNVKHFLIMILNLFFSGRKILDIIFLNYVPIILGKRVETNSGSFYKKLCNY